MKRHVDPNESVPSDSEPSSRTRLSNGAEQIWTGHGKSSENPYEY